MPADSVEVTKSISGAYWRMKYRGKVAFEEDEPTETMKKAFRESVDRGFKYGDGDGGTFKATIQEAR